NFSEVALQEVVEKRTHRGDGGEPSHGFPACRDRRLDDIGRKLECERGDKPACVAQPHVAALVAAQSYEDHACYGDEGLDRADQDQQKRHRIDERYDDFGDHCEYLFHASPSSRMETSAWMTSHLSNCLPRPHVAG